MFKEFCMPEFKTGDVVLLQSGGHEMTVTEVRSDAMLTAAWLDDAGVPHEIQQPSACFFLKLVGS